MLIDRDQLMKTLVVVGLASVYALVFRLPHQRAVEAKQKQIASHQQQITNHRVKAAQSAAQHASVSSFKSLFETAIPASAELGPLLVQLSEDLNKAGVTDQQLHAQPVVEGQDYSRIPLKLHFRGATNALFDLLRGIESHGRVIRIERITVKGSPTDPAKPIQIDVELSTFFGALAGGAS